VVTLLYSRELNQSPMSPEIVDKKKKLDKHFLPYSVKLEKKTSNFEPMHATRTFVFILQLGPPPLDLLGSPWDQWSVNEAVSAASYGLVTQSHFWKKRSGDDKAESHLAKPYVLSTGRFPGAACPRMP